MSKWYAAHSITALDPNSVQAVPEPGDYTELVDGDFCLVYSTSGWLSVYTYNASSTDSAESPVRLIPDGNVSGTGVWELKRMSQAGVFFNGTVAEQFNATVTSDGATVTMALEKDGGGDLTAIIPGDARVLPAQSIVLTAGSDVSPTANYIYVLASTPTVLTKSTSEWPTANHIKIAYLLVPSATYVQSHGTYINQNWNDGTSVTGTGQLAHLGEQIRLTNGGAVWNSGVAGNGLTDGYITESAGNVYFLSTAGICYQMHKHVVQAFDSETEEMLVVNDSVTAYKPVSDLATIVADSTGGSLNNKYYNLVVWMAANKTGEYEPVMLNLPGGSYSTLVNAGTDALGYDNYTIPSQFKQDSATGFLVCRLTFKNQAGVVTIQSTTDLRGTTPGTAGGGGSGGGSEFADNVFAVFNVGDDTKRVILDNSGLTTGITRTITPADADMKILSATNHDDLTDGGDTTLHDHDGISENTAARHTQNTDNKLIVGDTEVSITDTGADGTVTIKADGNTEVDVTDAGLRLGAANARVNKILDENDFASDSDTAVATQQSIKAYVRDNAGDPASDKLDFYQDWLDASRYLNSTVVTMVDTGGLVASTTMTFDSENRRYDFTVGEILTSGDLVDSALSITVENLIAHFRYTDSGTPTLSVSTDNFVTAQTIAIADLEKIIEMVSPGTALYLKFTAGGTGYIEHMGVLYNPAPQYALPEPGWVTKTAGFTAIAGGKYLVALTAGTTFQLPSAPSVGDTVRIVDAGYNFSAYNLVAIPDPNPIEGSAVYFYLDVTGMDVTFLWVSAGIGWRVING